MKKFVIFSFVAAFALSGLFLSCSDESSSIRYVPTFPIYYTVSFDSRGGSLVASQSVESGKTATRPKDPTKENCIFFNWIYYNRRNYCYEIFDFTNHVVSDLELVAVWERTLTANGRPIKDVIMEMTESGTVKASGLLNKGENEYYMNDVGKNLLAKAKESPNVFITLDLSAVEDLEMIGNSVYKPYGYIRYGYEPELTFASCSNLAGVVLPGSVTNIGSSAFSGCTSLASVTIPSGVTGIEDNAFKGCSSLASVMIPDSVTSIGSNAFSGCASLASVMIPSGVRVIWFSVFEGCSSLASITIPNSVTWIWNKAFKGCTSLENATFSDPNHWYYHISMYSDGQRIYSDRLANTATAAEYLTKEYCDYYWSKNN